MTLSKCFTVQPLENIAEEKSIIEESGYKGEDMSKVKVFDGY